MRTRVIACLFAVLVEITPTAFPQVPAFQWMQPLGGSADSRPGQLVVDADDNRYIVGSFKGTFRMGGDIVDSIGPSENVFITRTDPLGQHVWTRRFYSVADSIENIAAAADSAGGFILAGTFHGKAVFGSVTLTSRGQGDIYLTRLDRSGSVVWVRQAGGPRVDDVKDLCLDDLNNIYVGGSVWSSEEALAMFGGGYGGGPVVSFPVQSLNGYVARYDVGGALVWAQKVTLDSWSYVARIRKTPGGIVAVANLGGGLTKCVKIPVDRDKGLRESLANPFIWLPEGNFHQVTGYASEAGITVAGLRFRGTIQVGPDELVAPGSGEMTAIYVQSASAGIYGRTAEQLGADGPSTYDVVIDRAGNAVLFTTTSITMFDPAARKVIVNLRLSNAIVNAVAPMADGSLLVAGYAGPGGKIGPFALDPAGSKQAFVALLGTTPAVNSLQRGGGASSHAGAESVAIDAAGNRYVTGWYRGESGFSGHPLKSVLNTMDCFIAKYDKAGLLLWARSLGGPSSDAGRSIALDRAGNCYVAGEFNQTATFGPSNLVSAGSCDGFVVKCDRDGNFQWIRQVSGPGDDYCSGVTLDSGGNCYVGGSFSQASSFGTTRLTSKGSMDAFLAKYSASGGEVWVRQGGGALDDRAFGVVTDPLGDIYVTGFFINYAAFDGIIVNGFGTHDVFLAKYDSAGTPKWVSRGGGTGIDNGYSVAVAADGKAYVAGIIRGASDFGGVQVTTAGAYDVFLARYSPQGRCEWVKSFGGSVDDEVDGLAIDPAGDCFLTGKFEGTARFGAFSLTSKGGEDAFLAKVDGAVGDVSWVKQVGGTQADAGAGIAIEGQGNWSWCGLISGSVQFDSHAVIATPEDFFLATSAPVPTLRVVKAAGGLASLGRSVRIPVFLASQGDENALSMTLRFDPTVLHNVAIEKPASVAQLVPNASRLAEGYLGVVVARESGATFAAGQAELFTFTAVLSDATPVNSTVLSFGDEVLIREIDDSTGRPLSSDFLSTTLDIIRGYEGDVMPAGGDLEVTLQDWVKAGRFAAGLESPMPGDEATRADCWPYVVNTVFVGGDAAFTLSDYIQIGRLAAGLDAKRPQGGPAITAGSRAPATARSSGPVAKVPATDARALRLRPLELGSGESGSLQVEMMASGNENAVAFSLTLDPGLLEVLSVALSPDMAGGSLIVNSNHLGAGQLGVLLALPADEALGAGLRSLLHVDLRATTLPGPWTSRVEFVDFPVRRQVVDAKATELPSGSEPGLVMIGKAAVPSVRDVRLSGGTLRFHLADFPAGSVVIETSTDLNDWVPVRTEPMSSDWVSVPYDATGARFYRVRVSAE